MQAVFLQDFVRDIQRTYSRLVDDVTEYVFWGASWFVRGSWTEIGTKAALLIVVMVALHLGLGGAKAMGDKKGSAATMWIGIALVFAAGLGVALVLM